MSREHNHPDEEQGAVRSGFDDPAGDAAFEAARGDLIEDVEFTGRVVGQFQTD